MPDYAIMKQRGIRIAICHPEIHEIHINAKCKYIKARVSELNKKAASNEYWYEAVKTIDHKE